MARLNVEAWLASYLREEFPDVEVRLSVPDPRPKRLVVIWRGGGRRLDSLRERVGVHLSVYGGSEWETSELAAEVADAVWALNRSDAAMLAGISLVEEESLRSDPDTEAKPQVPRWFASFTLTTHAYPQD